MKHDGRGARIVYGVLIGLFTAVALVSCWKLGSIFYEYHLGRQEYQSLEQYVSTPVPVPTADDTSEDTAAPSEASDFPNVDFVTLATINPDAAAWLCIEDTAVNYPVVYAPDNDTYLTVSFNGTENASGCLFFDYRVESVADDVHPVIYGHHMRDGSMFKTLVSYKEQDFYDEHPTALLLTPGGNYRVAFFSGYVCQSEGSAWRRSFSDTASYAAWLEDICALSCFESEVVPTETDRVLTLSTCSYEYNDARFVLHGVLLPEE